MNAPLPLSFSLTLFAVRFFAGEVMFTLTV